MDAGLTTAAKLEPFLLMAKSARGAAAAKLVGDACAAPGVFVFGELLDMPSVADLKGHEQHGANYRLLELFAYGTYADYLREQATLPSLTPAQLAKLKLLTLVTLASSRRILPYADLQRELACPTIRALEDLIIDGLYAGVLRARLDQRAQRAEVEYVLGRDVAPAAVPALLAALSAWAGTTASVLDTLDARLAALRADGAAAAADASAYAAARDARVRELQDKRAGGGAGGKGRGGDARGLDAMDIDDDRAGGKPRKAGGRAPAADDGKGAAGGRHSKRNRF